MYADEKIMLTIDKITHRVSRAFNALEKRVRAIQRMFEVQISLAFSSLFSTTKKTKKKWSREELRNQQMQTFLSKPVEI